MDTYEKKYNEALERARKAYNAIKPENYGARKIIENAFPELRESEDERIRRELIDFVNHYRHNTDLTTEQAEWCKKAIAYLEKQKEQKPAEWSKEDEVLRQDCIRFIETGWTDNGKSHLIPWLKALPERFNLQPKVEWSEDIIRKAIKEAGLTQHQINWFKTNVFPPKQEWSEEDENELAVIISVIEDDKANAAKQYPMFKALHNAYDRMLRFLKSLRPSWKPSKEQIATLEKWLKDKQFDGASRYVYPVFESLYEQLQKLM